MRSNPQFNGDVFPEALAERQIGYRHIAALGGLRSPRLVASPNTLWRNKSFRNYADYALTPPFKGGLAELVCQGRERTCAIMCAEIASLPKPYDAADMVLAVAYLLARLDGDASLVAPPGLEVFDDDGRVPGRGVARGR